MKITFNPETKRFSGIIEKSFSEETDKYIKEAVAASKVPTADKTAMINYIKKQMDSGVGGTDKSVSNRYLWSFFRPSTAKNAYGTDWHGDRMALAKHYGDEKGLKNGDLSKLSELMASDGFKEWYKELSDGEKKKLFDKVKKDLKEDFKFDKAEAVKAVNSNYESKRKSTLDKYR